MSKLERAALRAAKIERAHATTTVAAATAAASTGAGRSEAKRAEVETLAAERAASVIAGDIEAIRTTDEKLSRERISLEVEAAAATHLAAQQAVAVRGLKQAEAAVDVAARAVLDAELIALSDDFTATLNAALEIGAKLQALAGNDEFHQPLNIALRKLPRQVDAALARMPTADSLHIPVSVLRGVGALSDGYAARLAALAA